MLTQEAELVSRMEAMLKAAREAVACKREKAEQIKKAAQEHRAAELAQAEKNATPPRISRRDSRTSWRAGDGTPRYMGDADAKTWNEEPAPKPGVDHEAENRRLKRELARVTEERDILKMATAYFARESQ